MNFEPEQSPGSMAPMHELEVLREELELRVREIAEIQRSLEETQLWYADLYDYAPLGYVVFDSGGNVRGANFTACDMFGQERSLLESQLFLRLVVPEDRRVFLEHLRRCRAGESLVTSVIRLLKKGGPAFPAELLSRPSVATDDQARVFRTAIVDLTEKKEAEKKLVQSEQRLQTAVEATGAGVFEVDLRHPWATPYLDEGAERVLDVGASLLTGESGLSSVARRLHPEDRERLEQAFADMSGDARERFAADVRLRRNDGSLQWVRIWARVTGIPKRGRRLVGVLMDVTTEKEKSLELVRQTRQLRALTAELHAVEERERRKIATELHDELAQLLVAAKMKLGLIRSEDDDLSRSFREQLESLAALLDRADGDVRGLIQQVRPQVLDTLGLPQALDWLVKDVKRQFDLEVDLQIEGEPPDLAERYRFMLFRCTRELLVNVAKHSGVQRAKLSLAGTGERSIRIRVEDEGQGFDPARLEEGGEKGFGLMSIRERVQNMEGSISIESAPGAGSRITLSLPIGPPVAGLPSEPPGADPGAAPPRGKIERVRVLLVDDHALVRDALARMLQAQGDVEVVGEASDGESALEMVRRFAPDVVLMDVTMPGLGGLAATRRIVEQRPETRVIGLSMHDDEDVARAMKEAGAVGYVRKTMAASELLGAIRLASRGPTSAKKQA